MERDLWERASEIFAKAIALPPGQVGEFLSQACDGDAELHAEVESMLNEDADATDAGFLTPAISAPAVKTDVTFDRGGIRSGDPHVGREIGAYRIERLIDHGGMGNVYLATRKADYSSQVAIKLIRRGMDSESVVARFQNEIQLQAALGKHPNIAGIIDAGQTEVGPSVFCHGVRRWSAHRCLL